MRKQWQKSRASGWTSTSFSAANGMQLKVRRGMGFVPIGVKEYVKLHVKANPEENPTELLTRLRSCISDALGGARCGQCGEPIWVVGSVFVGYKCFTCITGERD
jgi:hypothetical protein